MDIGGIDSLIRVCVSVNSGVCQWMWKDDSVSCRYGLNE